jgi:hypothetical protein
MEDNTCLKRYLETRFSGEFAWFGDGRSGIKENFTLKHIASWVTPEIIVQTARTFYREYGFNEHQIPIISVIPEESKDREIPERFLRVQID